MKRFLCVHLLSQHLRNEEALHKLALWALKFTPLVGINTLYDGITLDISGMKRLHKDEFLLAQKILGELNRYSINARAGLAPTVGAAWALACCDSVISGSAVIQMAPPERLREILCALKVRALRLNNETIEALQQIGVQTIGELIKLPRKALGIRFGVQLLKQLDRALGLIDEKLICIHESESFVKSKTFEVPLGVEAHIKSVIFSLLRQVIEHLGKRSKKACAFVITLELITAGGTRAVQHREIGLHHATQDFQEIAPSVEAALESIFIAGEVRSVKITPREIEAVSYVQKDFVGGEARGEEGGLLNDLCARLGRERINRLILRQSHIPERSFGYINLKECAVIAEYDLPRDRPPCLFEVPRPMRALSLLPDHPPSRIEWQGRRYMIIKSSAAEKICSEWWLGDARAEVLSERIYFRIQDENGRWLWVFRDSALRWFVHGVWG